MDLVYSMRIMQIPNQKLILVVGQTFFDKGAYQILDWTKELRPIFSSDIYQVGSGHHFHFSLIFIQHIIVPKHIPYSSKTNLAALSPLKGETKYQLLDLNSFQLIKRSKWKSNLERIQKFCQYSISILLI